MSDIAFRASAPRVCATRFRILDLGRVYGYSYSLTVYESKVEGPLGPYTELFGASVSFLPLLLPPRITA